MMDQGRLTGAGILAATLIVPALVVGVSLAVVCATLALECLLGALYVGRG
jgi:ABC-type spermidine/putrescine transport system permease subunit II